MDSAKAIAIAILVIFGAFVVVFDEASYAHFDQQMYPVDKAVGYLNLANTSSNLTDISYYLHGAELEIQNYTGNPVWWFKTPQTSWSCIKLDILGVQKQIQEFNSTKNISGLNYLQDISQLHISVKNIKNLLNKDELWIGMQPLYLTLDILYAIITLLSLAFMGIEGYEDETGLQAGFLILFFILLINGIIIATL